MIGTKFGTAEQDHPKMVDNRKGIKMWFLIKGCFWFSLVLIALPLFEAPSSDKLNTAPPLEVGQSVSAAMEAFDDISRICVRKPDICATGRETIAALGARAKQGAHIAYTYLDATFSNDENNKTIVTGSIPQNQ